MFNVSIARLIFKCVVYLRFIDFEQTNRNYPFFHVRTPLFTPWIWQKFDSKAKIQGGNRNTFLQKDRRPSPHNKHLCSCNLYNSLTREMATKIIVSYRFQHSGPKVPLEDNPGGTTGTLIRIRDIPRSISAVLLNQYAE